MWFFAIKVGMRGLVSQSTYIFPRQITLSSKARSKFMAHLCTNTKLLCIMGDFNLPDLNWKDYAHPNNEIYNLIIKFVDEMGLLEFVDYPTKHANTLDLLFSNAVCFLPQIEMMLPISQSNFKPGSVNEGQSDNRSICFFKAYP